MRRASEHRLLELKQTKATQAVLLQADHNRSGIMRTVVKDSNDVTASSTLDSDGQYNDDSPWPSNAAFLNVSNGGWHMATVTTRNDSKGFVVYMDGQLAGKVALNKDCTESDLHACMLLAPCLHCSASQGKLLLALCADVVCMSNASQP